MTTGEEEKKRQTNKKNKKKKKPRKDKWGQPLPSVEEEEEEEEQQQPFNESSYNALPDEEEQEEQVQEQEQEQEQEEEGFVGYENTKIVVSGMPYSTSEDQIRRLFKDIGTISQLQLSRFPDSGNFRGLAFVTFPTEEIARNALDLDGTKMGNRFIRVEQCRLDPKRKRKSEFLDEPKKEDGCLSAYIGNLSWDVTEDGIRDFLDVCNITSIRLALNKRTGMFRGFGHIDFADDKSLEEAMKKNQK
ncbi:hypothetical protein AAC387_Pa06g0528 [Persea americana]